MTAVAAQVNLGKTLPFSEESERAVLAAILLDSERHLPPSASRLRPDDFFLERHHRIFQTMLGLQDDGVEIDLRTLQARLEQQNILSEVGGLAYIATLEVDLPDLGRVDQYIEIVKERSLRRRLIDACTVMYRNCQDGGLEAPDALSRIEGLIVELREEESAGAVCSSRAYSATEFLSLDIASLEWIVDGLIQEGDFCGVHAFRGVG